MLGQMMDRQLLISSIIDHAARYHGDTEIVSVNTDGSRHRTNYTNIRNRALKLASAFAGRGLKKSDRVATIAWNNYRHLELYYGISGAGLVCHTLNPRLFPEQFNYIVSHADDKIIFFDQTFLPLVEGIRPHLPNVKSWILMEARNDELSAKHDWLEFYEDVIAEGSDDHVWPDDIGETDASSLCYTSGTTGNPKGVLYSHRSTLIHAMMSATPDVMNFSARDCLLPVVPMFHVNAWGTPYAAPLAGAKMVMPGPGLDGASLASLFNDEKVTISAGVPTIWAGLIQHLESSGETLPHMKRTVIGGSACPPSMIEKFRDKYDVEVLHAWGMTELSPLGSVNNLKNKHFELPEKEQENIRLSQGRPPFGIELAVFDDDFNRLPEDGETQGDLYCRGPWVLDEYYLAEKGTTLRDGWFATGDVATLDGDGFMTIRDRSKDIIKSGGEWISTVELENIAAGHPKVSGAAVIAAHHDKWDERPVLIAVKADETATEAELLDYYSGKVAKWQIPDKVIFVDDLPLGATGKILKKELRQEYADCLKSV
ncbi:MAG: long-chain-fatty-acid--CoA ligase [Rhizobiaceae bacterium]|nr:long-chain-fatty-acid--CoA ligase [Rhizobiaceae bacterium]